MSIKVQDTACEVTKLYASAVTMDGITTCVKSRQVRYNIWWVEFFLTGVHKFLFSKNEGANSKFEAPEWWHKLIFTLSTQKYHASPYKFIRSGEMASGICAPQYLILKKLCRVRTSASESDVQ